MFRNGIDPENFGEKVRTIFIKINGATKKVEKAWEGTTSNFEDIEGKIEFTVSINREIKCPVEYSGLSEGWYNFQDKHAPGISNSSRSSDRLIPAFMDNLATTKDWKTFENESFILLKCLGINDIYKFHLHDQRGKADGFFTFSGMSVLYDCTLESNFREAKKTQISNFCD